MKHAKLGRLSARVDYGLTKAAITNRLPTSFCGLQTLVTPHSAREFLCRSRTMLFLTLAAVEEHSPDRAEKQPDARKSSHRRFLLGARAVWMI